MTKKELIERIFFVIDDAKTAVLAVTDTNGAPHMRWMSPVLLPSRPEILYAVTSPDLSTAKQTGKHPDVEWMLQTRALNEVILLRGKINMIDNPSLKAEVVQAIGKRLHLFWKLEKNKTDFIVLETIIDEGVYYLPMKGKKEIVPFRQEN
ncbi:MAG: pyridoxamine 5'-phosphate oxidase family protein [Candidatus Anammoxibacter sp.]